MFFIQQTGLLCKEIQNFVDMLSTYLERINPSLLDRERATITWDGAEGSGKIRIDLPHKTQPDDKLWLQVERSGCIMYFAGAHKHFDDADWQERAFGFLQALLFGKIEVRTWWFGKRPAKIKVCFENAKSEMEFVEMEIYPKSIRLRRWRKTVTRIHFITEQDKDRLSLIKHEDDETEYEVLPANRYFDRLPAVLPKDTREFFDVLCERLHEHEPKSLDEKRTQAYWVRDEDESYLRITLPHKTERGYYVWVDVYAEHCMLYYGNGRMRLDGEDWIGAGIGVLGQILGGYIEVRSCYRGDHLTSVITCFLELDDRPIQWKRRYKRKWIGKKRVEIRRVTFQE